MLAAKTDNLSLISGTHMVDGENGLPVVVLQPPHIHNDMHTPAHTHKDMHTPAHIHTLTHIHNDMHTPAHKQTHMDTPALIQKQTGTKT